MSMLDDMLSSAMLQDVMDMRSQKSPKERERECLREEWLSTEDEHFASKGLGIKL